MMVNWLQGYSPKKVRQQKVGVKIQTSEKSIISENGYAIATKALQVATKFALKQTAFS